MSRTLLFFREFRRFHGGHLKVWDYFKHAVESPGYDARILFTPNSAWDGSNPWEAARDRVLGQGDGVVADAFFVAGRDWQMLDATGAAAPDRPVINLIQHVRHADPEGSRFEFLARPAVRICVSEEVRDAIAATGRVRGPVVVIPDGVDLDALPEPRAEARDLDLFIAGAKRPGLARRLGERLEGAGLRMRIAREHLPREEFLGLAAGSRVTAFLPNETEGFFLPALEGMALGTTVVCPDCVGNRGFCLDGETAFRPDQDLDALEDATRRALALDADTEARMRERAAEMAARHSLVQERDRFGEVLRDLDRLWSEAIG